MWITLLLWALGILAAVLVAVGFFWDRPGRRGRPALRCRKCWFDLTRAKDLGKVSRDTPIVCPECGRGHHSMRSMMRTRRRRGWIAAALVVVIAFHAVRVGPAVKARGWIAGVPGVCVVAMVPLFSEEEGSSDPYLPNMAFSRGGAAAPTPTFGELVFDEMRVRLRGQGNGSALGGPSRRLLFLLGRLESAETLTNPLTMKGTAYRSCVSVWVRDRRALSFEQSWARRQVVLEVTPSLPVYDGTTLVYGRIRARHLSGEDAWLSNSYHARFQVRQYANAITGFFPISGPGRTVAEWRELFRYDWTIKVDRDGERVPDDNDLHLVPLGYLRTSSDGGYSVEFGGRVAWSEADRFRWRPPGAGDITAVAEIPDDQVVPLPPTTQSAQAESWIRSRIEPELCLDYDESGERFRPALWFKRRDYGHDTKYEHGMLFGGRVEIRVRLRDAGPGAMRTLATLDRNNQWWLVEASREPKSIEEWRVATVRHPVTVDRSPRWLKHWYGMRKSYNETNQLVVCITGPSIQPSSHTDFKGLFGADEIYTGDIEIPIRQWTPDEFRRFIVSGYMPDHAME